MAIVRRLIDRHSKKGINHVYELREIDRKLRETDRKESWGECECATFMCGVRGGAVVKPSR